jgi:hypothetical protein
VRIADCLTAESFGEEERTALGRLQVSLMGDEYLPKLRPRVFGRSGAPMTRTRDRQHAKLP